MTWPIIGVRPRPPPTSTRKPTSPAVLRTACTPMSCTSVAARSVADPHTAILNLRGRYANSGWNVDHLRNSDPQHRRVLLDVQAVLQTQGAKLVLRQLAGEKAPRLIAKLSDALGNEAVIV